MLKYKNRGKVVILLCRCLTRHLNARTRLANGRVSVLKKGKNRRRNKRLFLKCLQPTWRTLHHHHYHHHFFFLKKEKKKENKTNGFFIAVGFRNLLTAGGDSPTASDVRLEKGSPAAPAWRSRRYRHHGDRESGSWVIEAEAWTR